MPFPQCGVWMYFICIIEIVWLENVCLLVLQSFILPMGTSGLWALPYFLWACHGTIASELCKKKTHSLWKWWIRRLRAVRRWINGKIHLIAADFREPRTALQNSWSREAGRNREMLILGEGNIFPLNSSALSSDWMIISSSGSLDIGHKDSLV